MVFPGVPLWNPIRPDFQPMKKLFHILFDTAWGPAAAWVVAGVLTGGASNACAVHPGDPRSTMLLVLVCLPLLLAALVALGAFVRSLLRRRFLHALLQILLIVAAQAATGVAVVPLLAPVNRSTPIHTPDDPPSPDSSLPPSAS